MYVLTAFTPWVLVVLLGYQVCASSGERSGADHSVTEARSRAQGRGSKSTATGRGKFLIGEEHGKKMQCTWVAQDVPDAVRLSVKCVDPEARVTGGVTELQCQYNAKPQLCPGYQSNPKGFWKHSGVALLTSTGENCSVHV